MGPGRVRLELVIRRRQGLDESLQWETERTWFKSAGTALCLLATVCGVWSLNDVWLRTAL